MSRSCTFGTALALILAAHAVAATTSIRYKLVPMGGNVYRYVYTLTNNGSLPGGAPIQLFDVYFDSSLYQSSSLTVVTPSSLQLQWSELILHPAPGVPAAYDVLSIAGGLPAGSTVSGFSVQFTWLGPGQPGSQPFEIFDPGTFLSLQTGQTVPEPATIPATSTVSLALLGVGLAVTAAFQTRSQIHSRRAS